MPSPKKKPALPDFNDFMEVSARSSITGKLLVNLVGFAGAGNGRCIVSETLPRLGQIVFDGRWQIHQYELVCEKHTMTVWVHIADKNDPKHSVYAVSGPTLRVSDAAFAEASRLIGKNHLSHPLEQMYHKCCQPFELSHMEERIREFFEHGGRENGSVLITSGGVHTQILTTQIA